MRFSQMERTAFEDTRRKRLAAARRQQRQRDALPLFAADIAAKQPTIDQEMQLRAEHWRDSQQERRDRRAAQWRNARSRIEAMEPGDKAAVLTYWNSHRWLPADPSYLLDALHRIDTGRLVRTGDSYEPARVVITPAEAVAVFGRPKPSMLPGLTRRPGA